MPKAKDKDDELPADEQLPAEPLVAEQLPAEPPVAEQLPVTVPEVTIVPRNGNEPGVFPPSYYY
jgi:hypothetical protein